jgi:hypothetical protein
VRRTSPELALREMSATVDCAINVSCGRCRASSRCAARGRANAATWRDCAGGGDRFVADSMGAELALCNRAENGNVTGLDARVRFISSDRRYWSLPNTACVCYSSPPAETGPFVKAAQEKKV